MFNVRYQAVQAEVEYAHRVMAQSVTTETFAHVPCRVILYCLIAGVSWRIPTSLLFLERCFRFSKTIISSVKGYCVSSVGVNWIGFEVLKRVRLPCTSTKMVDILLSRCAKFRLEEQFIDVRLKVGKDCLPAHRIVLAANSDYFYAMFTKAMKESNQELIELKQKSISAEVLKIILNYIYGEDLRVNEHNALEILATADQLHFTNVVQKCCDFLAREFKKVRFDVQRYCQLIDIADTRGLGDLKEAVQFNMATKYQDICDSEEFLSQIDADQLINILKRDDLCVPSETFVFKSVMRWVHYRKEERMPFAAKVIHAVRLGLVDITTLIEELNTKDLQQVSEIHKILFEASIYFNAPSQMTEFAEKAEPRAKSRVGKSFNILLVSSLEIPQAYLLLKKGLDGFKYLADKRNCDFVRSSSTYPLACFIGQWIQ